MRSILHLTALLAWLGAGVVLAEEDNGKDKRPAEAKSDPSLAEMRDLMQTTKIEVFAQEGDEPRQATFRDSAVFRYSDEPKFIKDSTLWIWTEHNRPVAIQKIENNFFSPTSPTWTYCFASLSEELIRATWPNAPAFETSQPGVSFVAVPDAPKPTEKKAARDRQFREIARQFSIKCFHEPGKYREYLRLLPRPIHEYESKEYGVLAGKIFGMASGTNPDALLIIELHQAEERPPEWRYAGVQMTSNGVALFHNDKHEWSGEPQPRSGRFENWTYMFLPRR